jgi:hypothetical protein
MCWRPAFGLSRKQRCANLAAACFQRLHEHGSHIPVLFGCDCEVRNVQDRTVLHATRNALDPPVAQHAKERCVALPAQKFDVIHKWFRPNVLPVEKFGDCCGVIHTRINDSDVVSHRSKGNALIARSMRQRAGARAV